MLYQITHHPHMRRDKNKTPDSPPARYLASLPSVGTAMPGRTPGSHDAVAGFRHTIL